MSETSSKESTVKPQRSDEGSPVSTPALEAEHLSRAVVGKVITNNISVQVHVGEILAVVGPSGSGKSSFLRLLNRLDEPTNGVVRLRGSCSLHTSFPEPWPRTSNTDQVSKAQAFLSSRLLLSSSASDCQDIRSEM